MVLPFLPWLEQGRRFLRLRDAPVVGLAVVGNIFSGFKPFLIGLTLIFLACYVLAALHREREEKDERAADREFKAEVLSRLGKGDKIPDELPGLAWVTARFTDRLWIFLTNEATRLMTRRMSELGPRPPEGYSPNPQARSDAILNQAGAEAVDSFNRSLKPTAIEIANKLKTNGADFPAIDVLLSPGHPTGMDEIEDISQALTIMARQAFGIKQ